MPRWLGSWSEEQAGSCGSHILTLSCFPGSLAIFCAVGSLPKRRSFRKTRTRLLLQAVLWSPGPKGWEGASEKASSPGPKAQWALLSSGLGLMPARTACWALRKDSAHCTLARGGLPLQGLASSFLGLVSSFLGPASSFLGLASWLFRTCASTGIPAPSSVDQGFLAGKTRLHLQQVLTPVEPLLPEGGAAGLQGLSCRWPAFPCGQGLGLWPLPSAALAAGDAEAWHRACDSCPH